MSEKFFLCLFSYLLASVPFGLIISKAFYDTDIREHGSRNIGATNIYRVLGKLPAILVLLLDGLKGALPVLIAKTLLPYEADSYVKYLVAFSAIIGHSFPIYLKLKGGKGVATSIFSSCAAYPSLGMSVILFWVAFFIMFRVSSVSSISSSFCSILFSVFFVVSKNETPVITIYSIAVFLLILLKHKKNIKALLLKKRDNIKTNGQSNRVYKPSDY